MYKPTIGLEIHAELKTKSKMFCACENVLELEKEPNKYICPVCTAQPGSLPVANKQAIENIIKIGLALNSEIQKEFRFFRKNYFYPDLPKGYQITSQEAPPAMGGYIKIESKKVKIHHIHLEEDTGKSTHPENTSYSLLDFNRAGIPLMELVSEPDIESGKEAKLFCQELQQILRALEISDADMEKGQMRCEVNISLSKDEKLGTKVEIKNLNSFRTVERAIDYEIERQIKILENGEKIIQETRGWDDSKQKTFSQRIKETAKDYRYFPEPDLPQIQISPEWVRNIECNMPELPQGKRERFTAQYGFSSEIAYQLILDKILADFTEKTISELRAWILSLESGGNVKDEAWGKNKEKITKLLSGWLLSKLPPVLQELGQNWAILKITPENFAEFIALIYENKISSTIGQEILREMVITGKDPSNIIDEKDLLQLSDGIELDEIVINVIKNNPLQVQQFKDGKEAVLQYLIGQVMKESKGKANPQIAGEILKKKLKD